MTEIGGPSYLGRMLDLLEMLAEEPYPVSYRDAAARLGAPSSSVHRLLSMLMSRGYCDRAAAGTFRPGHRLIHLGIQASRGLPHWASAQELVSSLGLQTGESASIGVLLGWRIVLIARHNSPRPLTVVATVGDYVTPHTSALGKAVLAHVPLQDRLQVVASSEVANPAGVLSRLEGELAEVARLGYSCDEGEYASGLRCRAVPILTSGQQLMGAASVSGPSARFTPDRAQRAVECLREAALRIVSTAQFSEHRKPLASGPPLSGSPENWTRHPSHPDAPNADMKILRPAGPETDKSPKSPRSPTQPKPVSPATVRTGPESSHGASLSSSSMDAS